MDELREALDNAFKDDEGKAAEPTPAASGEETPPSQFTDPIKPETPVEGADPNKTAAELDDKKPPVAPEKKEAAPASDAPKPPTSWKPAEREGWDKLPAHVQQAVMRREQEMQHNLQATAAARQVAKQFSDIVTPYKPIFDAEGVTDPMQGVQSLLQTAATLRMGNARQKAQQVAEIISSYGVDIGVLDSLLSGQQVDPQTSQFEQLLDQRLAPLNGLLQQLQQSGQQEAEQERLNATQSIAEFSKNAEFLNDVRNDMADLMDLAAKRGQRMTLQEAYNAACTLNPQIKQVMDQRAQQQRLQQAAQSTAQKKMAASSVSGSQGGAASPNGDSIRDYLEANWADSRG